MQIYFHELKEQGVNSAQLANIFEVSESAVSQWKAKGLIPNARIFELIMKRPDLVPDHVMSQAVKLRPDIAVQSVN